MLDDLKREEMLQAARNAAKHAYAPYSQFSVGAAILTADGRIHSGCNVENVSYPVGSCAEQNALGAMVTSGVQSFDAVLVLADSPVPISPCGGCRQRLAEFGKPSTPVLLANSQGIVEETTLGVLLPSSFKSAHLGG